MSFETLDLGKIIATAEGIKGMKRQAESDKIRDAYMQTTMAGAKQTQDFAAQDQQAQMDQRTATKELYRNQAIEAAPDPKEATKHLAPDIIEGYDKAHGQGAFEALHPEDVKSLARYAKEKAAAAAGINLQPDANVVAGQQFATQQQERQFGQQTKMAGVEHRNRMEEVTAANAAKPGRSFRAMTPQEVQAAGLPAGTGAQIDDQTGKIDVLTKRDTTGVLSQKDSTTAKLKINTVALARQQLNKIREAFNTGTEGASLNAFGPVQGYLPSEKGQMFDARVNQMRSTLTALTRVPGVGAMSDYETKLDQSKFPDRTSRETVTLDTLNNLDDQLALLERGYTDLLSGSAPSATPPAAQPAASNGGWTIRKVK